MIIALPHRSLIRFGKDDAAPFLNDLITAKVPETAEEGIRPGALLTPQGRILFDMLISRDGEDILIELDQNRADAFMKKMMMYRLRRDVSISADDRPVFACLEANHQDGMRDDMLLDTRFSDNVFRIYGTPESDEINDNIAAYQAYRYQHGVPEGGDEMPPEKALPLEARLDLDQGISFEKGCYIGQEVTARTRYRGLVKRSYLPVLLPDDITAPAEIMAGTKVVGELFGIAPYEDGFIGLASIRLDALAQGQDQDHDHDQGQPGNPLMINDQPITPTFPPRLMPLPARKES